MLRTFFAMRAAVAAAFNEAAGADPADAHAHGHRGRDRRPFNEAAGADPADARRRPRPRRPRATFNEAAGADPADAAEHDEGEHDMSKQSLQ